MRPHDRLAALALAALLSAAVAAADPVGSYLYVAPFGGFTLFDGSLRYPTRTLRDQGDYGARVGYQGLSWLGVEAAGGFTPTREDVLNGRKVDFVHGSGLLTLTPYAGRYGGPLLLVGGGAERFHYHGPSGGRDSVLTQGVVEFGGGLRLWLTDAIGVRIEARDLYSLKKNAASGIRVQNLIFGAGLTYAIGARGRDSDGDGVPDRRDRCPDTPRGAHVDRNGCPLDSDSDGVFDGLDGCPDTPTGAAVDAKGCPSDADGDGVFDGIDQCADTPKGATVDAKGCPSDADADSVLDGIDQCPNTPKGARVDERGCPKDGDGDGVPDGIDQCPDTPAGVAVDSTGCSLELRQRETELIDTGMIRLEGVHFASGKAEIQPEDTLRLNIAGRVLGKWPNLKIEVGGHTDSRGSNAANLKLSQARANAVRAYLLQHFTTLKPEQLSAHGYGETLPIVPNDNDENRARNRRVELKVLNPEVLKAPAESPQTESPKKEE